MCAGIAIIDDDVYILEAIQMVLEGNDWEVHTYISGNNFLAAIDGGYLPDCIILDPHFPGIDGREVAQALKAKKCTAPIIGLTANIDSPVSKGMLAAGARTMLTNPGSADVLISEIEATLNPNEKNRIISEPSSCIH